MHGRYAEMTGKEKDKNTKAFSDSPSLSHAFCLTLHACIWGLEFIPTNQLLKADA